jgi:hypothetical protein
LILLLLYFLFFGRWILAEETFEGIESAFPEAAVLGDPVFGLLQGSGCKMAEARASDFLLRDEAGVLEDADVLHHGGEGHAMWAGEVGHGGFAEHEGGEYGAASGVGESAEGGIKGCGILNHMV